MRKETRTIYIAGDGKEFLSEGEALVYERTCSLIGYLRDHHNIIWRDTSAEEVVRALQQGYLVLHKSTAISMANDLDGPLGFLGGFEDDSTQEGVPEMMREVERVQSILRA